MLDSSMLEQLRSYLERLRRPITLVASLDGSSSSESLLSLLKQIQSLHSDITLRLDGQATRRPSFRIQATGESAGVEFAAIPLGHEFTSLVLALLWAGDHPPKEEESTLQAIAQLPGPLQFEVYMSLSCHSCPEVVQALSLMALKNPRVQVTIIDGALFPDEVTERQVMAVPAIFLNGEFFDSGRMGVSELLARLDTGAAAREAERLQHQAPFEVLVVGGGPAGATAAIYAARKGIRTGLVAERFGGQTQDTLGIENFSSVLETQGPRFAADLEAHVRHYEVDVMNLQKVQRLVPASQLGGEHEVHLANGAVLKSRSVILSPGARWRHLNVPGEAEYRNRGVAYCPHCDGPLFKGKRVAVVGGGNSGVEAAIDLAGIVSHVDLIEFGDALRADGVLQDKLRSLPNVSIYVSAQTQEVLGKDGKVSGLRYLDRVSQTSHELELEGVFVQIGLIPNTDWLKDTVELSRHGEIVTDARGATSVPGVFAAGDATTVPYKQIIIAAGEGAKASLSAFDHLIRHPQP